MVPNPLACTRGYVVEEVDARESLARPYRALDWTGFILSLVVCVGAPFLLLVLADLASPFTGAAIDSYDANILAPADRATLTNIARAIGGVLLAGTILGVAALALGVITRRRVTIVAAALAPVVCLLVSFWTLAAAGSPDHIAG
jgi:hypothetical protein